METHRSIHKGMKVHSRDRQDLGKVVDCGPDQFIIEKGFFFKNDYATSYETVVSVDENDVYLSIDRDALLSEQGADIDRPVPPAEAGRRDDIEERRDIPLTEEQLSAVKHTEQAGEVQIRKDVVTEQRNITVPVSHEEVRVEEVPTQRTAEPGEAGFQSETMRIPIREEKVEVTKTPVVTGEVRVSKETRTDEQTLSGEVKKEIANIKREGQVEERKKDEPPPPAKS